MLDTILAHADTIVIALGIVAGWIWSRVRGEKTDSTREMLRSVVRGIVHAELGDLDDPSVEQKLRELVASRVSAWLAARKIKGAFADLLVTEAVTLAVAELQRLLSQRAAIAAQLNAQLADLATRADRVLEALKAPPLVPGGLVEIEIAPTPPAEEDGR